MREFFLKLFRLVKKKDNTVPVQPPKIVVKDQVDQEIKEPKFTIHPSVLSMLDEACAQIRQNKDKYLLVENATGVPWKVIAACHYRESSLSFKGCLHNGDPWNKVTVHVPKGRGPFSSWSESAIDALEIERHKFPKAWDLAGQLDFCERFNGLGYRTRGIKSPYVYAGTSLYKSGLYVADGRFSEKTIDKRLGCAAIIVTL